MIIGLTVTQINTLSDDIIAWCFSGSEQKGEFFTAFGQQISYPLWRGSVSALYFSQRLYQFPLGVLGISLATAIFPVMSSYASTGNYKGLAESISKGLKVVMLLAFPATAGLILVRRPLISALLEHGEFTGEDTIRTGWTLCFYAIGLSAFFAQQILTRAFYSLQESKEPMKTACIAVGVNLLLNLTLIWFIGTAGLALSTAVASYLQVVLLSKKVSKRFKDSLWENSGKTALKAATGTVVMGILVWLVLWAMGGFSKTTLVDIIRLCAAVPIGAAGYWVMLKLLKADLSKLFRAKDEISVNND
jgi:putative peptidoglycan lipid II flippase